ncbi:hypothetical protein SAMN04489716_7264 [Actinoplanes derwentensis]|uniref:Uncharacterized protein n=1 Tax=Actinoplanes derwentensis TaxID=113562 RepID=A0A1H2CXN3_9ACTN|nr:hypothetical protein SAMN04489716_7264 [Actinoplanes derwentensis]
MPVAATTARRMIRPARMTPSVRTPQAARTTRPARTLRAAQTAQAAQIAPSELATPLVQTPMTPVMPLQSVASGVSVASGMSVGRSRMPASVPQRTERRPGPAWRTRTAPGRAARPTARAPRPAGSRPVGRSHSRATWEQRRMAAGRRVVGRLTEGPAAARGTGDVPHPLVGKPWHDRPMARRQTVAARYCPEYEGMPEVRPVGQAPTYPPQGRVANPTRRVLPDRHVNLASSHAPPRPWRQT